MSSVLESVLLKTTFQVLYSLETSLDVQGNGVDVQRRMDVEGAHRSVMHIKESSKPMWNCVAFGFFFKLIHQNGAYL